MGSPNEYPEDRYISSVSSGFLLGLSLAVVAGISLVFLVELIPETIAFFIIAIPFPALLFDSFLNSYLHCEAFGCVIPEVFLNGFLWALILPILVYLRNTYFRRTRGK